MKYLGIINLILIVVMSNYSYSAGTTNYSHISLVQTASNGTYISNCIATKSTNSESLTSCISNPKCGTGKLFFIPLTDLNYDAHVSISVASNMSKTPVRIIGNGQCSMGSYENVANILIVND